MGEVSSSILLVIAVLLIGISKAGFGGGLSVLYTPISVIAFNASGKSPIFALGFVLPLMCAADAVSLYHYWGKWEKRNLWYILPGATAGIFCGVFLMGKFSPRQLNVCIGLIAIGFVLFQIFKERIFQAEGTFQPTHKIGIPLGAAAGLTSTIANGAGPVVAMFLIPQRLPKQVFVGTNTAIFFCINLLKAAFFVPMGIINRETLATGALLFLLIPLGVWIGLWLNRLVSEKLFVRLVYTFTFLTGVQLLLQ